MKSFNFSVVLDGINTLNSNAASFNPVELVAINLEKGVNIIDSLPGGITGVTDLNLGIFPLWRHLTTVYSNKYEYYGGEATVGVTLQASGDKFAARAISIKEYGTMDAPVDYDGKAALLMGNVLNINADGVERKQLGSLITIIPVKYTLFPVTIVDTTANLYGPVTIKRPTETHPANIIPADMRDAVYEKDNPQITSINIRDVALFNRSSVCYFHPNGAGHMFTTGILSSSTLHTGWVVDSGLPGNPDTGFNVMALKTTGYDKVNTFSDDVPYPRIINVQTLAANRSGYAITGYTLTVDASLGIDLTDTDKYMFMTNSYDATGLAGMYMGEEQIVEVERTANRVRFGGYYNNPAEGTQYLWVAIVQMHA